MAKKMKKWFNVYYNNDCSDFPLTIDVFPHMSFDYFKEQIEYFETNYGDIFEKFELGEIEDGVAYVKGYREETDEEFVARVNSVKVLEDDEEKRAREMYETLKERFEGK